MRQREGEDESGQFLFFFLLSQIPSSVDALEDSLVWRRPDCVGPGNRTPSNCSISTSFPAQMQLGHQRKWGRLGRSQGGAEVGHQHVPASRPRRGEGLPRLGRPRSGFRGDEWASQGSSRLRPVPAPGADWSSCRAAAPGPRLGLGVLEELGAERAVPAQRAWFPPCARTGV